MPWQDCGAGVQSLSGQRGKLFVTVPTNPCPYSLIVTIHTDPQAKSRVCTVGAGTNSNGFEPFPVQVLCSWQRFGSRHPSPTPRECIRERICRDHRPPWSGTIRQCRAAEVSCFMHSSGRWRSLQSGWLRTSTRSHFWAPRSQLCNFFPTDPCKYTS